MSVKKKLAPGSQGTKRFLDRSEERLICVRYRYYDTNIRCYTTVQLIVDDKDFLGGYNDLLQPRRHYPSTMVSVRVGYEEVSLRGQIKQAGGKWRARTKVWRIPYLKAIAIGLSDRLLDEQGKCFG